MEIVMELTGCGPKEAAEALGKHKEIWLAVDALMAKPVVSGEKYMPKKPAIDTGMTDEQKERCDRGRWLQDQVNAVFSVAHSQIQSDQKALEAEQPAVEPVPAEVSIPQLPSTTSSTPDSVEKSPLPAPQSELLR